MNSLRKVIEMELSGEDYHGYAFRCSFESYLLIQDYWKWEDRVLYNELNKLEIC